MAALVFSGKVHEGIQLCKTFETGFERKSDVKMMSFIGINRTRRFIRV